jgi:hypothetical protein
VHLECYHGTLTFETVGLFRTQVRAVELTYCPALVLEVLSVYGHTGVERLESEGINHLRRLAVYNVPNDRIMALNAGSVQVAGALARKSCETHASVTQWLLN